MKISIIFAATFIGFCLGLYMDYDSQTQDALKKYQRYYQCVEYTGSLDCEL
jgi:RAB protein geranylgeranyltransferase component A